MLVAAALAATLALSACGSDSEAGDQMTGTISKRAFLKKGNAICEEVYADVSRKYSKLSQLNGGNASEAELNRAAQKIVPPLLTRLARELRALGLPRGSEQRAEKILVALEDGIERAEENAASVRGVQGEFAFDKAYDMMWDYGLNWCGLSQ